MDLAKGVDKESFDVFVAAPKGWAQAQVKSQKLKVKSYKLNGEGREEKIRELREILRQIKEQGYPFAPIILHAHNPLAVYLASQAIEGLGIHLVYTEHLWTNDYHLKNWLREKLQIAGLRNALRQSSKVIAVSRAVSLFLTKNHIVPKDKVEVIYPIINQKSKVESYKVKSKISHSSGPISKTTRIGSIGALNPVKGYKYLIEAGKILLDQGVDFRIEIIGSGPELDHLQDLAESRGLKDRVEFIGFVESKQLTNYYTVWDIYVQPSLSESFGLAVHEALLRGLPVVVSRTGGLPEQVENGENGILVKPAEAEALADALKLIAEDGKMRRSLASDSVKIMKIPEFDGELNLNKINNLYREVVGNAK